MGPRSSRRSSGGRTIRCGRRWWGTEAGLVVLTSQKSPCFSRRLVYDADTPAPRECSRRNRSDSTLLLDPGHVPSALSYPADFSDGRLLRLISALTLCTCG